MKKVFSMLLFVFLFSLTGCTTEDVSETSNVKEVSIDVVIEKDGLTTVHTFLHIDRYQSLEEMLDSEIGEFKKLKIIEINDFSEVSNLLICEDKDSGEIIEVIAYKSFDFDVNKIVYLHLTWGEYAEAYMLSDLEDSIFELKSNGRIKLPNNFIKDSIDEIEESKFKEKIKK